jgi:hypothetical protein
MWSNSSPGVIANRAAIGNRLAAARAAQAGGAAPPMGAPTGGPGVVAAPPPAGPVPPAARPPVVAPAPGYKQQIAGHLHALGQPVSIAHIHSAIDQLHSKGKFTAVEAHALKAHNGPLVGPAGANTMGAIAGQLLAHKAKA